MIALLDYFSSDEWERDLWPQVQGFKGPFAPMRGRFLRRGRNGVTWDGSPDGCWNWEGLCIADGYGVVYFEGRQHYIHRLVYTAVFGPIPASLVIDHRCFNRKCCRPSHLEPVTIAENLRRGRENA